MKEVVIKEVRIRENYKAIARLMDGLHRSEKALFEKTAAWADIEESYMRHVMEMQEECKGTCLVAYDGEIAIGFLFGYAEEPDDSRIDEYTGEELYISDGYVEPEYRKRGIYKEMNRRIEEIYLTRGMQRITRFTMVNNEAMKRFLESEGYRVTRVLWEKWKDI